MVKFCKLCLIVACFGVFWIPEASPFSWNITPIINKEILPYFNFLYLIPFIFTFFFGMIFSREEFILFFSGGLIASFIQGLISLFDTSAGYYINFLETSTYLPLTLKIILQIFFISILYALGLLSSKYIINKSIGVFSNNNEPNDSEDNNNLLINNINPKAELI